ncbi:universal stress protein [Natronobacterium gregoryi]|uniref:Universal stress protein n=2 Tax=Natronobacterium gregoryi TaxID=44930 RepID=L0AHP7_NATGS|nr:universal stress protein [Natronobacterium gregoryi]AFZ72969.1 universal stress protein UspA-like protein [Natronobacterium gregoryi SP2]ELY69883.1 UpsA domain-containing protein [Natronobacterium gregoryi SP2]PLK21808.1 universal stress protein [Natronobacterium gregoryi SP2]SFI68766.1 Nucleotide-binding universal stress protein, UspA family [Natronobacterium gregoryi]
MAILAAIDETERSERVVEVANDLATTYDDPLVALHVVPDDEYRAHKESLEDIPGMEDFSLSQQADSAKRFAQQFVIETVDVDTERLRPRGRVGAVTDEILAEVDDLEPRYLVIGGRHRSPAGKVVFGSTAQRLLLDAGCPVVSQIVDGN